MSAPFLSQNTSLQREPSSSSTAGVAPCPPLTPQRSAAIGDQAEKHRCSICAREFRRRDALSRHVQIHDKNRPRPRSRKKACICCVRSKIKCLGEQPSCSSCIKRNQPCEYDVNSRPVPRAPASTARQQPMYLEDVAAMDFPQLDAVINSPAGGLTDTTPNGECDDVDDQDVECRHPTATQPPPVFDFSGMVAPTPYPPNVDSLAWIFEDNLDDVFQSTLPSPWQDLLAMDLSCTIAVDETQQPRGLEQENGQVGDPNEEVDDLPQPTPQDRCSPDDVWPMEWHAASAQRLTLPALGSSSQDFDMDSGSFYAVKSVTESVRARLQNSIRLPLERVPWQTASLTNFPSQKKLDHCIDLFFRHFDRTFTVVHRPTFDPSKFPVLALAMISVGACYTNFEGAQRFSISLSELVRRLLIYMAEYDPRFLRSDQYLAAKLIQSVQGYCGASRRLFELSESSRSSLVHNAKSMGLFCYKAPSIPDSFDVEERWHHWITHEKYRRLGWAVYLLDSSVSYLHNSRPHLSISDIDMEMPSSSDHWQAESAHSWAALHPWTEKAPKPLRFVPLCSSLVDDTEIAIKKLNPSHHRYFILTLIRMIWSLKEINASPMSKLGGVAGQLNTGRDHLQSILDQFLHIRISLPVSTPLTKFELADAYREAQIIHMSHLHGAGDLVDWLHALLRSPNEENARVRMIQWAAQDARRVRNVAYHSSQVLSILRHYPANYPLEPFSAFHAGTVLWCVTQVLPRSTHRVNEPVLRLDKIPTCGNDSAETREWIATGVPSHVCVFGVPNLASEEGKDQVLEQTAGLLKRMTCWNISQNFLKVIMGLTSSGLAT